MAYKHSPAGLSRGVRYRVDTASGSVSAATITSLNDGVAVAGSIVQADILGRVPAFSGAATLYLKELGAGDVASGTVVTSTGTLINAAIPPGSGGGGGGGAVSSVAGKTGAVVLAAADIPDLPAAAVSAGIGTFGPVTYVSKTSAYTAVAGEFVMADATSAGFTVTAPASPTAGHVFGVKKIDSGANVVTVVATSKTIDGDANATLVVRNAGGVFQYDGTNWKITAVTTSTGSAGPPGLTGPTGGSGVQPLMGAGVLSSWYLATGTPAASLTNQSTAAGTLLLGTPYIAPEDMTIDAIGSFVSTAGTTGALLRLGIYLPSAVNPYKLTLGSAYATLLVDAGTVAAETSSTRVTATLGTPQVITKGTAFCVGVAAQVATVGIGAEGNTGLAHGPWGTSFNLIWNGPNLGVRATGVTAGLPATFTPSAFNAAGVGGCGWFRRSA